MIKIYHTVFRLLLKSNHINASDLNSYTKVNFRRFLWDNFINNWWSSATYNSYRKYLKVYCWFLVSEWLLEFNPIDEILKRKEPKKLPKSLTKHELEELFLNLENAFSKDTFVWYRNITIVYTFVYTWLRLSELTNLNIKDVNLLEWYIRVVKWKWDKERYIPIVKDLIIILSWYLKFRKKEYFHDWEWYFFPTIYWNNLKKEILVKWLMI